MPEDQSKDVSSILVSPWGSIGRTATITAVAGLGKLVLGVANYCNVVNAARVTDLIVNKPPDRPLITVSNHTSTLDDPFTLAAMLPLSFFAQHANNGVRWTFCAKEVCFKNSLYRQFFLTGKTLPIERGEGPDQPIMRVAAQLLRGGAWLHVFPEGHINYTGKFGTARHGIGKLVCDCVKDGGPVPMILPIYHAGMGQVMPYRSLVPRVGNIVTVTVGEPIEIADLCSRCNDARENAQAVWSAIAKRVEDGMRELERRCPPNAEQKGTPV